MTTTDITTVKKARAPADAKPLKTRAPAARNPKPEPRKSNPICKRDGCKTRIPDIAMDNLDPFCSTTCAKIFFGVISEEDA